MGRIARRSGKVNCETETQFTKKKGRYLERERSIHEKSNHPLIIGNEKHIPATKRQSVAILGEFVPNGSLTYHLPELNKFWNGTRSAMMITEIVLAVRWLHSQCTIHRAPEPANMLIDWNLII
jgi:serine/threonine protein kinase